MDFYIWGHSWCNQCIYLDLGPAQGGHSNLGVPISGQTGYLSHSHCLPLWIINELSSLLLTGRGSGTLQSRRESKLRHWWTWTWQWPITTPECRKSGSSNGSDGWEDARGDELVGDVFISAWQWMIWFLQSMKLLLLKMFKSQRNLTVCFWNESIYVSLLPNCVLYTHSDSLGPPAPSNIKTLPLGSTFRS